MSERAPPAVARDALCGGGRLLLRARARLLLPSDHAQRRHQLSARGRARSAGELLVGVGVAPTPAARARTDSHGHLLTTLLISNQVVELKQCVYKRYDTEAVSQMLCAGDSTIDDN